MEFLRRDLKTPGTPVGDVDQEHENNIYALPEGRPIRRQIKKWFKKQLKTILGQVPAIGAPLPDHFPSLADYDNPMASAMTPLIGLYWDESGKTTRARLGLDPNAWEVHDPHLHEVIKKAAFKFCQATNETTDTELGEALEQLRQEFIEGLVDRGETITELTKRVQKVFTQASKSRAERIARTEASRAVHTASLMSAKKSGVVSRKKWLASADACDRCLEQAAKFPDGIPLDTQFEEARGDPAYADIQHPPLHPHCMCSVTYVLTDEYEELLADHGAPNPEGFEPGAFGPEPGPRQIAEPFVPEPVVPELPIRHPIEPTPAEPIGEYLPSDEEIAKPSKKDKKPAKPRPEPFPRDPDALEFVKTLGGSTGAQLVKDKKSGKLFVRKKGNNPDHLREELIADDLYRAMGVEVPRSKLYEREGGPVKLSEFHEGKTLGELSNSNPEAYEAAVKELRKGFVADALLGNWDVIGSAADNIIVKPTGEVLRIDNGGSLRFRAQGSKKGSSQWTNIVGELQSLRNTGINPAAARVFGGITDEEINVQAKALVRKKASLLKVAPEELRPILEQRLQYLKDFNKPVKIGKWKPSPESEFFRPSSTREAEEWADKHYKEWGNSLTQEEKSAIHTYTGSGYGSINSYLRSKDTSSSWVEPVIQALDSALDKKLTPAGLVAFRQYNISVHGRSREQLRPGMDLDDAGFTSTTLVPGGMWHGDLLEVRIPKGTPGGWMNAAGSHSSHSNEKEFLLSRKVDKLRIVEVKHDRIIVEAVLPKKAKGTK
jgi:ADP-ribosyltransferase exoenzyme/Phage Mu protein F like protein